MTNRLTALPELPDLLPEPEARANRPVDQGIEFVNRIYPSLKNITEESLQQRRAVAGIVTGGATVIEHPVFYSQEK